MVDPRIYRALLAFILLAVIVFGFSLENQPGGAGTTLAPGQFFQQTFGRMQTLADRFPDRSPGSAGDSELAALVARDLSHQTGFTVHTTYALEQTADGTQDVENVVADRPGLAPGTIVVISHRDATGYRAVADMSGTAVMLSLAHALSGAALNRGVELISTSGQVGLAGASALAQQLVGHSVDAVIVLGNLAGAKVHGPVVVPWSGSDLLAPPMLRATVSHLLTTQTGIHVSEPGLGAQLVRLSFPFSTTEQAPFNDAGLPAVLISLSGDQPTPADAHLGPVSAARLSAMGTTVLQSVDALSGAQQVPPPSSYLVIGGKAVPLWAVRLLVLALILPVAATAVDALARARRRGHSVLRWVGWVLASVVPFLLGLIALYLLSALGALSATPPGAVGAHGVAVTGGDLAVVLAVLAVIVLAFWLVRPFCLRLAARLASGGQRPQTPAADAAAVALTLVLCVLALIVWAVNPYTALLFVPALHLWLWLAQPGLRSQRTAVVLVVVAALVPTIPIIIYYLLAYGLTPWGLVWSIVLMIAGGAMPPLVALYGTFTLGCFAGALVIAVRAARSAGPASGPQITVRGPAGYAGPGSLGGTQSALRR